MVHSSNVLAVVTGASSGIGFELAKLAALDGYHLVIAAHGPEIVEAAEQLRAIGVSVESLQVDLSTLEGAIELAQFVEATSLPVEILIANAGTDLGGDFLGQDIDRALRVIDTNIRGTVALLHILANRMKANGRGKILITGSIVGAMPGPYQAVYAATKAFLNSFSTALRYEMMDSGVTVTCLMPGATNTPIYERANMLDTQIGLVSKADPADVAKAGFSAMLSGKGRVVPGLLNKVLEAAAHVTPSSILTRLHAHLTKPRSGSG